MTAATRLPGEVHPDVKKRRSQEMHDLSQRLSESYRRRFLGRQVEVLWEEPQESDERNRWTGLTDNYLRVWAEGSEMGEGTLSQVRLVALQAEGFQGQPV